MNASNAVVATKSRKVVLKQMVALGPVKNFEVNDAETGETVYTLSASNRNMAGMLVRNEIGFRADFAHLVPQGF